MKLDERHEVKHGIKQAAILGLAGFALAAGILTTIFYVNGDPFGAAKNMINGAQEANNPQQQTQAQQREVNKELTDAQKLLVQAYSDNEKDIAQLLEARVWVGNSENSRIEFANDSYQEFNGANAVSDAHPIAIQAVKMGEFETTQIDNKKIEKRVSSISVLTTKGTTSIITLTTYKDGKSLRYLIASDLFQGDYVSKGDSVKLDVEIDNAIDSYIGNKHDELVEQIKEYVGTNYPRATSATWKGAVSVDTTKNTNTFEIIVSGASDVTIKVAYNTQTQQFSF